MKKIVSLIVSVILLFSVCITTSAAGSSALNGSASVTVGSNIEFTVSVSGCGNASSIAVDISHSDNFELVSGTWLKTGSITKFDTATKKGALGGLSSPDVNGNIFKVVLKANAASANNQTVSVNVIARNGSTEIMNVTPSKSVKINCATHSYGNYSKKDNSNHTRTCSACGNIETKAHTWNGGSVTKTANCKEAGTKTFTCTATGCGATKTETIAKTNNHTFGSWSQTKAPKCAEKGQESRTCSTCKKVETRDIKATGHSLSGWKQTKAPACEAKGEQTRSCSKCSYKETKAINALGHKFSNATVTKAPTCTATGIETGKCTVCNKETTNTIPATGHKMGESVVTKEPTCTEEGKKEGTCTVCGTKAEEKVAAKGHTFGEAVVTKEATETEEGLKTKTCSACGETEEEVIPVLAPQGFNPFKNISKKKLLVIGAAGLVLVAAAVTVIVVIIKKKKAA